MIEFMLHPRNRKTEARTPSKWTKVMTVYPAGTTTTETFSSQDEFELKTIGDHNNGKAWRKKMRGNRIVASNMTLHKQSRSAGGSMNMVVNATWTGGSRRTTYSGDFSSTGFETNVDNLFLNLEGDLGSMRSVALSKAMAKMNGSEMLIGETMKDYVSMLSMLRRPFQGATDLVGRMVKSRNRSLKRSGSNLVQASADCWLEYRYGWKPLLMDADTVFNHVIRKREPGRELRVARAEVKRDYDVTKSFSFGSLTDPKWNRAGSARRKMTVRACSGVVYGINNHTTGEQLARLLGTRACDLPSTVWESIPFSFVVDWFANVGPWIRASVPDPSIEILAKWTTSMYKCETEVLDCIFTYSEYASPGNYAQASAAMNRPRWTREWVQRNMNPTYGGTPVLTINVSPPRILDAIALSSQSILRSLGSFRH